MKESRGELSCGQKFLPLPGQSLSCEPLESFRPSCHIFTLNRRDLHCSVLWGPGKMAAITSVDHLTLLSCSPEARAQCLSSCWTQDECSLSRVYPELQQLLPTKSMCLVEPLPEKSNSAGASGRKVIHGCSLNLFGSNGAQRSFKGSHPLSDRRAELVVNILLSFLSVVGVEKGVSFHV